MPGSEAGRGVAGAGVGLRVGARVGRRQSAVWDAGDFWNLSSVETCNLVGAGEVGIDVVGLISD